MAKPHDLPSDVHLADQSSRDEIYGLPSVANRSLSDLISPDDWRLYHLMRELSNDDRHRILTFAEMLHSLQEARRRAAARHGESIVDSR